MKDKSENTFGLRINSQNKSNDLSYEIPKPKYKFTPNKIDKRSFNSSTAKKSHHESAARLVEKHSELI